MKVQALSQEHLPSAATLLAKSSQQFRDAAGTLAEDRLKQALARCEIVRVAIRDKDTVIGLAFHDPCRGWEVHSSGPASVAAALVSFGSELEASEKAAFWEQGYLIFGGLLAWEAPTIRTRMDLMMKDAQTAATADWNAVDVGGPAFVLAVDTAGKTIPNRILKVQAAALGSGAVLEVFRSPAVVAKVKELYNFLGQEVPEHVDVFGTKFFPMWPGGVSVDWHQDCHYFGTASSRIISCGVYLEDTDQDNGCLQVVPGSHTFDFEHQPGSGLHSQGEWVNPDASTNAVDVVVPAGSVVLFNSRLLHAARQNKHASRTRYSLFGHFVPSELDFSWRGTDFSHGTYQDRHQVY
ncbi:htxA [Symbiodinium pilosum]|uniref:HtxA protein n=1 Tax=Symbiodinium pilosum TaxID=2952 RepID=A0A812KIK8_SYMPI|nr:htxA [Symbiodinium pilosum]